MCYRSICRNCHKATWGGCGSHISQIMDYIPKDQWCNCEPHVEWHGTSYPRQGNYRVTDEAFQEHDILDMYRGNVESSESH
ncbi:hypothetical protein N656DRAFT_773124 [Canariomyces notabilis]|uniref:Uncharacterized protein n=1 Tax=Canariomyces notabilis TaxID=2074819 RepID=A0AAN6TM98_9PEZI|nr:hypothetical protein N656DRAFT_773124 [Canariomyces arenarius]